MDLCLILLLYSLLSINRLRGLENRRNKRWFPSPDLNPARGRNWPAEAHDLLLSFIDRGSHTDRLSPREAWWAPIRSALLEESISNNRVFASGAKHVSVGSSHMTEMHWTSLFLPDRMSTSSLFSLFRGAGAILVLLFKKKMEAEKRA